MTVKSQRHYDPAGLMKGVQLRTPSCEKIVSEIFGAQLAAELKAILTDQKTRYQSRG